MPPHVAARRTATPLTLADFAALVGAPPRWCQNALQTLGLGWRYETSLARVLGLARLLHEHQGIPLRRAVATARNTLSQAPPAVVRVDDPEEVTALVVDVPRYLTQFALRAARLGADAPRRRGRPARPRRGGVTAAAAHGLDLGALRSGLRLAPAERLRQLDANQRLIAALRQGRTSG